MRLESRTFKLNKKKKTPIHFSQTCVVNVCTKGNNKNVKRNREGKIQPTPTMLSHHDDKI